MAHYAYLDENNIVIDVIVGKDETELIDGVDTETYYEAVRTSYNSKIRGTFAGIGYSYNKDEDIFITPQPYYSWIRNGSFWDSPIPKPEKGLWNWNEEEEAWNAIS